MRHPIRMTTMLCSFMMLALLGCQNEAPAQQPAAEPVNTHQSAAPPAHSKQAVAEPAATAVKLATATASQPAPQVAAKPVVKAVAPAAAKPASSSGESGSAIKADDIRAEPFGDAKAVGRLAAGDRVDILNKEGGWLQINSQKGNGWVRMLTIRKGDAVKGGSAGGVLGLASGRAGTGKVVATTGIRGLNEEELKAAKFNEAEVALAESYATGKAEADAFAAQGKLVARPFNYLAVAK